MRWTGEEVSSDLTHTLFKIIQLASDGLLKKIARCADPACGLWFFKTLPHKKFHTTECQVRVFEADEGRKEARRLWARNHYQRFESRKGFSRRGRKS
jgi:hypothetical protein